jgi:DNA polymerase III epsilon subunit-like protein
MSNILFVIDCETTGLDYQTAGVVEIGAVAIKDGAVVAEFSSYCWPGYGRIRTADHQRALEISGISPAKLLDAPEAFDAVASLLRWAQTQGADVPVCVTSYNVAFDRPFFEAAFSEAAPVFEWCPCVMLACRNALGSHYRGRYGPSLARACDWLGIPQNDAHRALEDARCAAEVWLALERRG